MIAVHIDVKGEYKAVCAAIALEGRDKKLVKLNEKEVPRDATMFWGGSDSVKAKYKKLGIKEWKPAKKESVDG